MSDTPKTLLTIAFVCGAGHLIGTGAVDPVSKDLPMGTIHAVLGHPITLDDWMAILASSTRTEEAVRRVLKSHGGATMAKTIQLNSVASSLWPPTEAAEA